ncbi:hypothetical protein J2T31_002186 [Kerstersia gyiorum]|nr:hypothetical protein [Kerstersia gyiorum]MCP1823957.1 hypothetical protein [Kerstersia gyiorum]MCP1827398.1 hypothetical protein [Kerstersia gyiorum]MCW2448953.1 hypothetical protein [Kerstersia gyiorum]
MMLTPGHQAMIRFLLEKSLSQPCQQLPTEDSVQTDSAKPASMIRPARVAPGRRRLAYRSISDIPTKA